MNFYEFFTLLEGQAEDLIRKNPGLQAAYDQGVRNPILLKWVSKASANEPMEDVIPVAISFEKNKQRLVQKDIGFYKSAGQLRQAIEDLGRSGGEREAHLKENETTRIGQFGEWIVVMPHTKESSCQWGKGTTWCTAATQSGNLFLTYTGGRKQNVILYYLIRRGANPRQNPESKISIGFVDGAPVFKGVYGGVTVDAQNKGLDETSLMRILGAQYDAIMRALNAHSKSLGGKHPAKNQMETIAKSGDPKVLEGHMSGMKPEEKKDFLDQLIRYELSDSMLKHLVQKKEISEDQALLSSSSNGNLEMVKRLYHDSPPEEWISFTKPSHVNFALIAAAENDHLDIVKFICERDGEDLKGRQGFGIEKAFVEAAKNGRLKILRYFLDSGLKDSSLAYGMEQAAADGQLDVIRFLADPRKFGCDADGVDEHELNDGLEMAARRGRLEAVKLFVDIGADNFNEAFALAASYGRLDVLKFLLDTDRIKKHPAFVDRLYDALSDASGLGILDTTDHLFKVLSEMGHTKYMRVALDRAARNGKMNTVRYLVENGVEISRYCLAQAAEKDQLEVLKYLIEVKTKSEAGKDSILKDIGYALNLARGKSRLYLESLVNQYQSSDI